MWNMSTLRALVVTLALGVASVPSVVAQCPNICVTPDGAPASALPSSTGNSAVFTVTNGFHFEQDYDLTCERFGRVSSCSLDDSYVNLGASGGSAQITVLYSTSSTSGAGTIRLKATQIGGDGFVEYGTYDVAVGNPGPTLTPDGAQTTAIQSSSNNVSFTLTNHSGASRNYTFSCVANDVVFTCTPPSSVTGLAASASTNVTALFNTSAILGPGSLTVTVVESGTGGADNGSYKVTVLPFPPGTPTAVLKNFNRDVHDRSLCLTVGAGEAAAMQCGDLVVTHSMPAYRTLGRDRTLTLIYNSGTAAPQPVVATWVTQPTSADVPQDLLVQLSVKDTVRSSHLYAGWTAGTKQVAMTYDAYTDTTGIYAFTTLIRNQDPCSHHDVSPAIADTLPVVNRSHSEFGAGWYLAGVENLVRVGTDTAKLLWVGGDGAAKVYRRITGGWLAPAEGFRDTIKVSGGGFVRTLKDSVRVVFDNLGRHTQTITKAGHVTTFRWGTPGGCSSFSRLLSITVPPSGADSASRTYNLDYNCSSKRLTSITDPAGRVLTVSVSAATSHDSSIAYIDDPDGIRTSFSYNSWAQMTRRTNRRQYGTSYAFSTSQLQPFLSGFATPLSSQADTAITSIRNWFQRGLGIGDSIVAPADTATVYTMIDGPRSVGDSTRFWVDQWGAPTKVLDPLGHQTLIARLNETFPAMATRVEAADGRVLTATYNLRANVLSVTDNTHEGTGVTTSAVTTYHYGTVAPDSPDLIMTPVDTTVITYHDTLWLPTLILAQGGHKTAFTYFTSGVTRGLVSHIVDSSVAVVDTSSWSKSLQHLITQFAYDFLGNDSIHTSPKGGVDSLHRDSYRRVTTSYDPVGHQTEYGYDLLNRMTSTTIHDGATLTTVYHYDSTGVLDSVVDPRGVKRKWLYDAGGRQTYLFGDGGYSEHRFFGPSSLLDSVYTRNGDKIAYTYDADGRLTQIDYPAASNVFGGGGTLDSTIAGGSLSFIYDAMDRVLTASNPNDTVVRVYNREGTLRSERQESNGLMDVTMRSWYDQGNRRTKFFNGTDTLSYSYGSDGFLSTLTVTWQTGSWSPDVYTFHWDGLGRRDSLSYPNGAKVHYGYDRNSALRMVCSVHAPNSSQIDYLEHRLKYAVNGDGLPTSITRSAGGDTTACASGALTLLESIAAMSYDARHELTQQTRFSSVESFTYDSSGNRTAVWSGGANLDSLSYLAKSNHIYARYSPNGQVQALFSDHPDGSRMEEAPGTWDGHHLFYYNSLGQLTGELSGAGPTSFGGGARFNTYDAIGRKVGGFVGGPALGYDGDTPIRLAGPGHVYWRFIHGPGTDDPLVGAYEVSGNYEKYYYLTDGRGRQLAFTDQNGNNVMEPVSTIWGTSGGNQAGSIADSHGFSNSRSPSPLMPDAAYYRNRFYDQKTGRFLTEDPIGIAGGVNLYQYSGNNPATYTDPFGLCPPEDDEPCSFGERLANWAATHGHPITLNVAAGIQAIGEAVGTVADLFGFSSSINCGPNLACGIVPSVGFPEPRPSLSSVKAALEEVHELVGKLPKGALGKFNSPQRGNPIRGYRLDPGHPGRPAGDPEAGWHINWWDYTLGKRGAGGLHGAVPINE